MCGIIGILSNETVANRLIDGLSRLEYRGYDSSGIATIDNGSINRIRSEGKLQALRNILEMSKVNGSTGIAHTRWATHGLPTQQNAHPHATDQVAVVHNGIIENYQILKKELLAQGVAFQSETDTEVVVHLIDKALQSGKSPEIAVQETITKLEGAFALAIIFKDNPNMLIGARRGSPLVLGINKDELFLGSDAWALAPWTQRVCYLEEGDLVIMHKSQDFTYKIYDEHNKPVNRPIKELNLTSGAVNKGNYSHFMLKEIFEQPQTISDTLLSLIDEQRKTIKISPPFDFTNKSLRIRLISCGTSYYACLVAKYWFEKTARIMCEVDLASEFRYRDPVLNSDDVCLFVSQSGETIDTLAALSLVKDMGCKTVAIVNVPESSMARQAHEHILTLAGPEIGVASTKAFTAQLMVLNVLALQAAEQRGVLNKNAITNHLTELLHVPKQLSQVLKNVSEFDKLGFRLSQARDILFIGRGTNYPIALEGALKLKEISYIHAEAYAAGELKHGPIALIDKVTPLIAITPNDTWFEKTASNIQEVAARGAPIFVLTDKSDFTVNAQEFQSIKLPTATSDANPFIYACAMQCIAYYTALHKGTDVDQPRNLAKSVTVE